MVVPSLAGIIVFYALLIAYTEYQLKQSYDQLYSSTSRSLAFANKLLGASLGFSSDSLTSLQGKKAKNLLRLIALNANVQCLAIESESYALSYPPSQYCSTQNEGLIAQTKLQKSTGLTLSLYIDSESIANIAGQSRLLNYGGGTLLVFGALASGSFYSYRKSLNQQAQTDRLIDEIIASSPNPYIILNENFKIASISESLRHLQQNDSNAKGFDDALNNSPINLDSFFSTESAERISSFLCQLNIDEFDDSISLKDLRLASKKPLVFTSTISVIRKSKESNYFLSLFDETQSFVQKNYLAEQLRKDSLTGAFSRRYLFETCGSASRLDKFYLFLIDVDDFKEVNDSYGHAVGDQLLLEVSLTLTRFCGSNGKVFRLGGDEFVVLLHVQGGESISSQSSWLYSKSHIVMSHLQFSVDKTFSFGATEFRPDEQLSVALKRADNALIQAKKSGKHAYMVAEENKLFDSLLTSSPKYSLSISQIQDAFASDSVELYLQPVFNTNLKCAVGYEALVRLNQDGQVVPPNMFLDSLYKLSELPDSPVDHYHLFSDLMSKISCDGDFWISYNVNEIDLGDSLFERLLEALTCLPTLLKSHIVLEVSETTFLAGEYSSSLLDRILLLKSKGFRIALDDFGVLSSNIFALSSLPVDIVKLDKFLVTGIIDNLKNQRIIESLKSLSDSLDFELLAEGIELPEEAACLEDLGIVLHQGFLYGRPAPVNDFPSLLLKNSSHTT